MLNKDRVAAVVADCAGQLSVTSYNGRTMYVKPKLERFGSLRELTLIGTNADCDGGIFGISAVGNGDNWWDLGCHNRS